MSCSSALEFCISNRNCPTETVLVTELSKVRTQLSQGLAYYSSSKNSLPETLKEPVRRFISKLAVYLKLPEGNAYELFVHFLATHFVEEDTSHHLFLGGSINESLVRIRSFYWQERLAVCGLLGLALCHWHPAWSHVADILFAITNHESRTDLLRYLLKQYAQLSEELKALLTKGKLTPTPTSVPFTSLTDQQEQPDELHAMIRQSLEEQLELLCSIQLGVHALSYPNDGAKHLFYTLLDTFKSSIVDLSGYGQALLDKICFVQSMILIRAAHLDSFALLGQRNHTASECRSTVRQHFLSEPGLLNRLLNCFDHLGSRPVHGPVLLFGALCAAIFPQNDFSEVIADPTEENVALMASQYGRLAIERLNVFTFMTEQLDVSLTEPKEIGLSSLCTFSAVFDLLSLMSTHISLQSLDSAMSDLPVHQNYPLLGLPNRSAFVHLISKALRVISQFAPLNVRIPCAKSSNQSTADDLSRQATIGQRLAVLIETLSQSFPDDLGLLRLCSALMIHKESSDCPNPLVQSVTELTDSLPYLAEHLTSDIAARIQHDSSPWYPSLSADGDFYTTNQFSLARPYTLWDGEGELKSKSITLPVGTRGFMVPEQNLVIWNYEYSVWSLVEHECSVAAGLARILDFDAVDVKTCAQLSAQLMRLNEFVEFANRCVQANVRVSTSLNTMQHIWPVSVQCLDICSRMAFTSSSAQDPLIVLFSCLLPASFALFSSALTNMASEDAQHRFAEHATLWIQVLDDSGMCFLRRLMDPSSMTAAARSRASLTSTAFQEQLSGLPINSEFHLMAARLDCHMPFLIAYLELASTLLTTTKWLRSWSDCGPLPSNTHAVLWTRLLDSIRGSIVVCMDYVLGDLINSAEWSRVTKSKQLLTLIQKCLVFLTDLLTSDTVASTDPFSANPTAVPRDALAELQYWTFNLLSNNPKALSSLFLLSSVSLQAPFQPLSCIRNGLASDDQLLSKCESSSVSRDDHVVWLALVLIHRLLTLEHSMSNESRAVMKTLKESLDSTSGQPYVWCIFQHLRHLHSTGVLRCVLAILKWLVQYSDLCLMNYLGKKPNQTRQIILKLLSCQTPSPRAGMFDLLAETILCGDPLSKVPVHKADALIRLLSSTYRSPVSGAAEDPWFGGVLSGSHLADDSKSDIFQCCRAVLEENMKLNDQSVSDQAQLVLQLSVTKFIAALHLQGLTNYLRELLTHSSNFWDLLTSPLFQIIKRCEGKPSALSLGETELCGHIVVIIGLTLINMPYADPKVSRTDSLIEVLKKLNDQDVHKIWFQTILARLDAIRNDSCLPEKQAILTRPVRDTGEHSHLTSLYDATCRWKFCLTVQLNSSMLCHGDNKISFRFDSVTDRLLACLEQLSLIEVIPGTAELAYQLGICLTLLSTKQLHFLTTDGSSRKDTSARDLEKHIVRICSLLISLRPGPNETTTHLHSELLASCSLLLRCADRLSSSLDKTSTQLHLDVLDCALGYVAQLSLNAGLSESDEMVLRLAISLLLQLWEDVPDAWIMEDRIIQTGLVNNLLHTFIHYSKRQSGASICHDILSLLCKPLISRARLSKQRDSPPIGKRLYPRLDQSDSSTDCENRSRHTQAVNAFSSSWSLFLEAFQWPPVKTLLDWVTQEEEEAEHIDVALTLSLDQFEQHCSPKKIKSGWTQLLLLELRFLCLLHDSVGSQNDPFSGPLLEQFCTQNLSQLEALFVSWSSTPKFQNAAAQTGLPPTSSLIHHDVLSPVRLKLSEWIGKLFWRMLSSAQSLCISSLCSGPGQPMVGMNALFRSAHNGPCVVDPGSVVYSPTYGPPCPVPFAESLFRLAEFQLHLCTILFQRPGYRFSSTRTSSRHTPVKSTESTATVSPGTRTGQVDLPGTECPGELELTYLARHLVSCLSLIAVQLPSLGYISLFTSEELHESQSPVQLIFNSPNMDDTDCRLTFGLLLTLARSLEYLIGKISGHSKPGSVEPNSGTERNGKLLPYLVLAHEMTLTIIFSQAILLLASSQASPSDKELLVRELTAELKSYMSFGRGPFRRAHSSSRRSSTMRSSHSPGSRSPSVHSMRKYHEMSPYTPGAVTATVRSATGARNEYSGSQLCNSDFQLFGFEQAIDRFTELLRGTF